MRIMTFDRYHDVRLLDKMVPDLVDVGAVDGLGPVVKLCGGHGVCSSVKFSEKAEKWIASRGQTDPITGRSSSEVSSGGGFVLQMIGHGRSDVGKRVRGAQADASNNSGLPRFRKL